MKKLLVLSLSLSLSLIATAAQAATMTQSQPVNVSQLVTVEDGHYKFFDMNNGVPDFAMSAIYPLGTQGLGGIEQFDPGLGTLDSVSIGLEGTLIYTYDAYAQQLDNIAPGSPVSVEAVPVAAVAVSVPRPGEPNQLRAFSSDDGSVGCTGTSNCLSVPVPDSSMVNTDDNLPNDFPLDAFIGGGYLTDIDVILYAGIRSMTESGTEFASIAIFNAAFTGHADITYTYTTSVVPIPAALPLFGSAFGLLGFFGWRRQQQRT